MRRVPLARSLLPRLSRCDPCQYCVQLIIIDAVATSLFRGRGGSELEQPNKSESSYYVCIMLCFPPLLLCLPCPDIKLLAHRNLAYSRTGSAKNLKTGRAMIVQYTCMAELQNYGGLITLVTLVVVRHMYKYRATPRAGETGPGSASSLFTVYILAYVYCIVLYYSVLVFHSQSSTKKRRGIFMWRRIGKGC